MAKIRAAASILCYLYGGGSLNFFNAIQYFLTGDTLLENFCTLLGVDIDDVISSSSDSWKSTIDYTLVKRYYQYYDISMWEVGLVTAKVTGYDTTELKLTSASTTAQTMDSQTFSRQGAHYGLESAWTFALGFNTDNSYYEYPTFKIGGKTFIFV